MSSLDTTQESSVLFNLRQLMQLEHERVAQEERALRERQLAEERALARAAEQERAEEAARALRAREATERAAVEREAALLRVQLEAAALERKQDERLEQAQRELERVQTRLATRLRKRNALLTVACVTLASATGWWAIEGDSQASGRRAAAALLGAQAREIGELRARLSQLSTPAQPAPPPSAAPMVAASQPVKATPRPTPRPRPKPQLPVKSEQALLDLEGEGSDPIEGLLKR